MTNLKSHNKYPNGYQKLLKFEDRSFLENFSRRSSNALISSGIVNENILYKLVESGEIFKTKKLGLIGLKEIVTWAWKNKK